MRDANRLQTTQFEGTQLKVIDIRGRPAWIATEVGRALGYENDGARLGGLITNEWSADFKVGTDFEILQDQELRDLKDLLRLTTKSVVSSEPPIGARARACMVLYESGVDGVALRTTQPVGVRLRRWLRDEVLPKLRRGEGIPARGEEASQPRPKATADVRAAREQRLLSQMQVKVIENEAARALARGLDRAAVDAWRTTELEKATGIPMSRLLPVEVEQWYTLSEVAAALGVPYKSAGTIVSLVSDFKPRRNIDGMLRMVMNHAKGQERSTPTCQYTAAAIKKIRPFAEGYRNEQAKKAEAKAALEAERAEKAAARATARAGKAPKATTPTQPEQGQLGFDDATKKTS